MGDGAMGSGATGYDDDDDDDGDGRRRRGRRWRDDDDGDDDGDGATGDGIRRRRRRQWRRLTKTTRVVGAVHLRVGDLPVPRHAMTKSDGGKQRNNQRQVSCLFMTAVFYVVTNSGTLSSLDISVRSLQGFKYRVSNI